MRRRRARGGFTLVEVLIALVVLMVGLAIATGLLGEAQQMLADVVREARDPAAALVATRLRGDIESASSATVRRDPELDRERLELAGPQGRVVLEANGGELLRTVLGADGTPLGTAVLLQRLEEFRPTILAGDVGALVCLEYAYRRSRLRRSPLPLLPGQWGPREETVRETLCLTPRGAGLGGGW